jgi:hypothetical protein
VVNPDTTDEARYNAPPSLVWEALKASLQVHKGVARARFEDQTMRADFATTMTGATWGQKMCAIVRSEGSSSCVKVEGVANWRRGGRRDDLRIRKIASELFDKIAERLPTDYVMPEQTEASPPSVADELAKLAALRDSGILSVDEFEELKAKLLRS